MFHLIWQEKLFAKEIQHAARPNSDCFQPENGEYEIWGSMDTYANGAEQFHDITMVCFKMGEAN